MVTCNHCSESVAVLPCPKNCADQTGPERGLVCIKIMLFVPMWLIDMGPFAVGKCKV